METKKTQSSLLGAYDDTNEKTEYLATEKVFSEESECQESKCQDSGYKEPICCTQQENVGDFSLENLKKLSSEDVERLTQRNETIVDMTLNGDPQFGITKMFNLPHEFPMAEYAVTQMVKRFGHSLRDMKNISNPPVKITIETDINQKSVVYEDIIAVLNIGLEEVNLEGLIQAIFIPGAPAYRVCFSSTSKENVALMEAVYTDLLEGSNFYQGKTLRFSREGVVFLPTPNTELTDVVLPEGVHEEYRLNVIRFLRDSRFWEKVKKRSLLLYGPPGTGKTSSIAGFFNHLRKHGVTCVWISDESFQRHSVESVFSFVNTYLAPCLMVFEDIDLIAMDRSVQASSIIGPLLSALNGITEQQKPIVIVATTNRAEVLDSAVTRPCRFDRKLHIDYPSDEALNHMFKQKSGFEPKKDAFKQGESKDKKLTGAHIEEIYNTSELLALDSNRKPIDCVEEAVEIIRDNFFVAQPSKLGFGDSNHNLRVDSDEDSFGAIPVRQVTPDDKDFYV